jgi:hypothetical protein
MRSPAFSSSDAGDLRAVTIGLESFIEKLK